MHSHHALPMLVILKQKGKLQFLLTSVCLCNHSTAMTEGQGEGKMKLHRVNLVAAGSPLTDMGFVRVFCS